nr:MULTISPECIES: methyltransferase domain-containing protein [unclassified Caballeronia]
MTASANWQAHQYSLFEAERTRPVRDLLHAAVDLGSGPGNSTETLLAYAPHARVVGIDSSADMIDAARKRLPQVRFELADNSI